MDNSTMETENLAKFAKWLLDIGNDTVRPICLQSEQKPYWIQLPKEYLIKPQGDTTSQIFKETYPYFCDNYSDTAYLKERIMVSPLNDMVHSLNDLAPSHIPGESSTYFSCDTAIESKFCTREIEHHETSYWCKKRGVVDGTLSRYNLHFANQT
ncbi:hypothetical protein ACFE04_027437 [Oxalis oulophora]